MRRALSTALCVAVFSAARPVHAQEEKKDLDIVVTTGLLTIKEHVEAYKSNLHKSAAGVFGLSHHVSGEPPKPGAAWYRLEIEHKGTAWVADQVTKRRSHGEMEDKPPDTPQGATSEYFWYIKTSQSGKITFRLKRWEGEKYRQIDSWTEKIRGRYGEQRGQKHVWVRVSRAAKSSGDKSTDNMCPISLTEARRKGFMDIVPGPIEEMIYDRLFRIKVSRAKIDVVRSRTIVRAKVTNRSPWAVSGVEAVVRWVERRVKGKEPAFKLYEVKIRLGRQNQASGGEAMVMPGRSAELSMDFNGIQYPHLESERRGKGWPRAPEGRVVSAKFRFDCGPEWIRRRISGLESADENARDRAASAMDNIRKRKNAEEMKVAIKELVRLSDHEDPAVRRGVVFAMGRLRAEKRSFISAVIKRLSDEDAGVRARACEALGEIGKAAKTAVPTLKKCLEDEDENVRSEAESALDKITGDD